MSRAGIRVHQVAELIRQWDPSLPFSPFLKQHSRQHREWGSRDRREIKALAYAWFRLGEATKLLEDREAAIAWAAYLFESDIEAWVPEWKDKGLLPHDLNSESLFEERFQQFLSYNPQVVHIFPLWDDISAELQEWNADASLATQSKMWLRPLPNKSKQMMQKLETVGINYQEEDRALGIDSGIQLDQVLGKSWKQWGEVQDIASQQVIRQADWNAKKVWDCCAASGGKSLQMMQEFEPFQLLCSDIRESIIENLKQRFREAGMRLPKTMVADLSDAGAISSKTQFDMVLADVPCSGSGVFGRNPDAMMRMSEELLIHYSMLQEKIVKHVIPHLQSGGQLLYATCSVYAKENEAHLERFKEWGLELERSAYLNYRAQGGDVLFYALFKKS